MSMQRSCVCASESIVDGIPVSSRAQYEPVASMEVCVQSAACLRGPSQPTVVHTHPKALVDSLVAVYCQEQRIPHEPTYGLYTKSNKYLKPHATLQSQNVKSGDTLYLKHKDDLDDLLYYTNWKLLAIVTLILGAIGVLFMCLVYTLTGGDIPFVYGIVVDAGSSHSEITVYHWLGDKYKGTGKVEQVAHYGIDGGIGSYEMPRDAGKSLLFGLDNISSTVPEPEQPSTPIYLGATAGMRLLNLSEPEKADSVLMAAQMYLGSSRFSLKRVGIISGKDEGLFGWLSTNYLNGRLLKNADSTREGTTFGALDLGGASTQISFEIPYTPKNKSNEVVNLKLYGRQYSIFSRSYLCFGANEAFKRHLSIMVMKNSFNRSIIQDPCLLKDYTLNKTARELFGKENPCTQNEASSRWLEEGNSLEQVFSFAGSGDSVQCDALVNEQMNFEVCSQSFKECFYELPEPIPDVRYSAFSAFFYTMRYFKTINSSLETFASNLETFCNKSWNDVKTGTLYDKYYLMYCFQGYYVKDILLDKYKFNSSTWRNIAFLKKVNGYDIGWSLGYMINATNALPAENPSPPLIQTPIFAAFLVAFILMIMFSSIFAMLAHRRKKNKTSSINPSA